jgi:hypothetical protein
MADTTHLAEGIQPFPRPIGRGNTPPLPELRSGEILITKPIGKPKRAL